MNERRDKLDMIRQIDKEIKKEIKENRVIIQALYNFYKRFDLLNKLSLKKFLRIVYIFQCIAVLKDIYKVDYADIFSYFILKTMGVIKYE